MVTLHNTFFCREHQVVFIKLKDRVSSCNARSTHVTLSLPICRKN